jgi:uncharacterized membrane protein
MGLRIGFDHPLYLWMLIILPLIWWIGWGSLRSLGTNRRLLALLLRSAVATAIIFALAGIQWIRTSNRLTVIYLLDQSQSIPAEKRRVMLDYVIREVREDRSKDTIAPDRAGIIVFGREAAIEIPPYDDDVPNLPQLESYLGRTDGTNLSAALKLAQAAMPEDSARRIVIVTDGNENLGDARKLAAQLVQAGIGIDVVPVELSANAEVVIEKIDIPGELRRGQPVDARVVATVYLGANTPPDTKVRGQLKVIRSSAGDEQLLLDSPVELQDGTNVLPFREQIEQPAPYTYRAEFIAQDGSSDGIAENNQATNYTYVRGKGRVLLIEDAERTGEYEFMVQRLRKSDIEVVVQSTTSLFASLSELQAYDAVILAGVSRASVVDADDAASFSDDQIEMLVRYIQQLGAGVLMIGGPEAFGAGGWAGTKLEEAMPVDFQVKNRKVQAIGALAMIMHACEMPQGNFWEKQTAKAAIDSLGPNDYCGVLEWSNNGKNRWLWGGQNGMLEVGAHRKTMLGALQRMVPMDMPDFDSAMRLAANGLKNAPAAVKHCIIISDGDPSPPSSAVLQLFTSQQIKISTVAIGTHDNSSFFRLRDIANATGGKCYVVSNPKALPKIYQREARRISRPLVFEPESGVQPSIEIAHPIVEGLGDKFPNTKGFVLTEVKENPLVQVVARSPAPAEAANQTILAVWNYGLGRAAVLTTDSGHRWATDWQSWEGYDKFFTQLVRYMMRPPGDNGKFNIVTQAKDGKVRVTLTALDKDDNFLDGLPVAATALDPSLKPINLELKQESAGTYVGTFDADNTGSYFVTVLPQAGAAPLSTGVSVPYSDEFRARESNFALLRTLAALKPIDGAAGVMTASLDPADLKPALAANTFRRDLAPARSLSDFWPWLALIGCGTFLADCVVRRVSIDWAWLYRTLAFWNRAAIEPEPTARLDRLRGQKQAIATSMEKRRAAARFNPDAPDATSDSATSDSATSDSATAGQSEILGRPSTTSATSPTTATPSITRTSPSSTDGPSYTERLLAAKKAARKEKDGN